MRDFGLAFLTQTVYAQREKCTQGICLDDEIAQHRNLNWIVKTERPPNAANAHPMARREITREIAEDKRACIADMRRQLSDRDAETFCMFNVGSNVSSDFLNFIAEKNPIFCKQERKSNEFMGPNGLVRVFASVARDGKLRVSSIINFIELRGGDSLNELTRALKTKHPCLRAFNDEFRTPWDGTVTALRLGNRVEYSIHANNRNFGRPNIAVCGSNSPINVN